MSVIVRMEDDTVKVMMKGADSSVIPLLKDKNLPIVESTMNDLNKFAQ